MATLVDPRTGQVYEGLAIQRRRPHPYGQEWVMLYQPMLTQLGHDRELTGEVLRVLVLLLGRMDFGGTFDVNHTALAREMGIRRPAVSRAIKVLVTKDILRIVDERPGLAKGYALNPHYGFKGSSKELGIAQKTHLRLVSGHINAGTIEPEKADQTA